ncbi:tumor necrosis factor receptor superfamily member 8 [Sphaerodactylus townsendi]|uniref:tumor necrosis factor receptor superfamily member 8 n=1 Tax=Sphaerodactylus townsendi TaxID=933632 RepID=UPI002025D724|nr:tumor necrosis factor receptor superfamily member 8 [Sphaerodactylus townsendi]
MGTRSPPAWLLLLGLLLLLLLLLRGIQVRRTRDARPPLTQEPWAHASPAGEDTSEGGSGGGGRRNSLNSKGGLCTFADFIPTENVYWEKPRLSPAAAVCIFAASEGHWFNRGHREARRLKLGLGGNPVSSPHCKGEDWIYSSESQKCCYRCPSGFAPKTACPTNPRSDCMKQCGEGQFLNHDYVRPQCELCLTCNPERDLVQKAPCTRNSSGVCECRPGLYCQTKILNSCARCQPLTTCKPGYGVKTRGTSDQDTVCEKCPPGTFSTEDSSTETCKPQTDRLKLQPVTKEKGNYAQDGLGSGPPLAFSVQQAAASRPVGSTSVLIGSTSPNFLDTTTRQPMNESNTRGPSPIMIPKEKDVTFLAAALLFTFLLLAALVVLWKKKAYQKWVVPHNVKTSKQTKIWTVGAEKGPEEAELHPESLSETSSGCPLEMEETSSLDPEEAKLLQVDGGGLVEPVVRSHTSNCIEKIYIMRADTVIVGSVSELPAGKTSSARGEEGICGVQEEGKEVEADMHYPEQETEFSPGSDITTPVEEEWEFPRSILANEKPLGIQEESSGGAS